LKSRGFCIGGSVASFNKYAALALTRILPGTYEPDTRRN
jgi:hypothetical protein